MCRNTLLVFCLVLLLAGARGQAGLASQTDRPDQKPRFSRSEWIRRHMIRLPSSGGALPVSDLLPAPDGPVEIQSATSSDLLATEPVRVNNDLLATDTLAQPETQAEPYLHANPSDPNNLLAGWQENRFTTGGARVLNFAVSFDGGQAWTEGILPQLTEVNGGRWEKASDPWVAFGPSGRAYYATLLFNETTPDNAVAVSRSTNGGATWGAPVEVFRAGNDFNDKEAVTVDTFPDSPHFGNIYVAWDINVAGEGQFVAQRLVVARSTDGGASYQKAKRVRKNGANVGAVPRVGPDGTVYVVWAGGNIDDARYSIYFSKSKDGGRSWSKHRRIAEIRAAGVRDLRVGDFLPSLAVDPNNGDIYVAWSDSRWTGADQATLIFSRDGGASWSDPARVSDGPDDAPAFTISVAVNGKSDVAISYYSLQNDPARRFLVDKYVRISADGGRAFDPSIRATRSTFDVRSAAQTRGGYFLGDYAGLTGTDRGFHLLWVGTQRRSPVTNQLQPDVFTARAER